MSGPPTNPEAIFWGLGEHPHISQKEFIPVWMRAWAKWKAGGGVNYTMPAPFFQRQYIRDSPPLHPPNAQFKSDQVQGYAHYSNIANDALGGPKYQGG